MSEHIHRRFSNESKRRRPAKIYQFNAFRKSDNLPHPLANDRPVRPRASHNFLLAILLLLIVVLLVAIQHVT